MITLKSLDDIFDVNGNFYEYLDINVILWFIDSLDDNTTKLREYVRKNEIKYNTDCTRLFLNYNKRL